MYHKQNEKPQRLGPLGLCYSGILDFVLRLCYDVVTKAEGNLRNDGRLVLSKGN